MNRYLNIKLIHDKRGSAQRFTACFLEHNFYLNSPVEYFTKVGIMTYWTIEAENQKMVRFEKHPAKIWQDKKRIVNH